MVPTKHQITTKERRLSRLLFLFRMNAIDINYQKKVYHHHHHHHDRGKFVRNIRWIHPNINSPGTFLVSLCSVAFLQYHYLRPVLLCVLFSSTGSSSFGRSGLIKWWYHSIQTIWCTIQTFRTGFSGTCSCLCLHHVGRVYYGP